MELANQKRSWKAEEAGLHQKLDAVEMELAEVRREKEEYQKGSILTNLETVALGNQVSALKMDIASRREPIVCEQVAMETTLCVSHQDIFLCCERSLSSLLFFLPLARSLSPSIPPFRVRWYMSCRRRTSV